MDFQYRRTCIIPTLAVRRLRTTRYLPCPYKVRSDPSTDLIYGSTIRDPNLPPYSGLPKRVSIFPVPWIYQCNKHYCARELPFKMVEPRLQVSHPTDMSHGYHNTGLIFIIVVSGI